MRCFGWLVTLLHISSKTADDIVGNNDQVILPGFESEIICVLGTHYNEYNKKSWQDQINFFLIMLNWSIPKEWNLSIENLHIEIQFSYSFRRQNGQVVKAMDWKSIGLFKRGFETCLLYTSPSPRDLSTSRMPSSAWKKKTKLTKERITSIAIILDG